MLVCAINNASKIRNKLEIMPEATRILKGIKQRYPLSNPLGHGILK